MRLIYFDDQLFCTLKPDILVTTATTHTIITVGVAIKLTNLDQQPSINENRILTTHQKINMPRLQVILLLFTIGDFHQPYVSN